MMMSERPTICEPEGIVHRPVGKMVNGQPAGWQCRGCDWTLEEVTGLASAIEDWWDWPEHRGVRFDVETDRNLWRASAEGRHRHIQDLEETVRALKQKVNEAETKLGQERLQASEYAEDRRLARIEVRNWQNQISRALGRTEAHVPFSLADAVARIDALRGR